MLVGSLHVGRQKLETPSLGHLKPRWREVNPDIIPSEVRSDSRCKRFRTREGEGESIHVENVIAETLAKSPPSFRVLIIYFGRK